MMIFLSRNENRETHAPLCCKSGLADLKMAGTTVNDIMLSRWEAAVGDPASNMILTAPLAYWPSVELLAKLAAEQGKYIVVSPEGDPIAWKNESQEIPADAVRIPADEKSFAIQYPWDLLKVHEEILSGTAQEILDNLQNRDKILGEFAVCIYGKKQ